MALPKRRIKAKYRTMRPQKVKVLVTKAQMVKQEGTDSYSMELVSEVVEKEMFTVFFPQDHSIRVERPELIRMGLHRRPRLVDMETGETVDFGGDPYDFMGMPNEEREEEFERFDGDPEEFELSDEIIEEDKAKVKTAKI